MVTTTTQYSFQKPTVGDDEDAWGGYLNNNFDSIDSLLRGATSLSSLSLTGNITFGDNDKAIFGAGSDLQIYHDGSNSYISDQGTGDLRVLAGQFNVKSASGNTDMIYAVNGDAVTLYHNGNAKLATTSTGVDITGTLTSDGLTVDKTDTATYSSTAVDDTLLITRKNSSGTNNQVVGIEFDVTQASGVTTGIAGISAVQTTNASSADLVFQTRNAGTIGERMRIDSGGDISFYEDTGTTPKFFWDASAESLGIGTTSPSTTLHIASTSPSFLLDDTDSNVVLRVLAGSDASYIQSGTDLVSDSAAPLVFGSIYNATEWMRITSSGKLGVNVQAPDGRLEVQQAQNSATAGSFSGPHLRLSNSTTTNNTGFTGIAYSGSPADNYGWTSGVQRTSTNGTEVDFIWRHHSNSATGTEVMRIDSSGNLLLGTSTHAGYGLLQVGSTSTASNIIQMLAQTNGYNTIHFGDGTSGTDRYRGYVQYNHTDEAMLFGTSASERMRIDSSGNLLVGKTSATYNTAGIRLNGLGFTQNTRDGDVTAYYNRTTSDGDIVQFAKDGTTVGSIGVAAGNRLTIGDGDTGLRMSGSLNTIVPWNVSNNTLVDNAIDLGESVGRFKNLYLSGTAYVGNRISHDGDTDTYIQFGTNTIYLVTGGSSEITVNTTGVRLGDTGNGYFQPVSGNYGSIQIDGGAHGGWEGYSIGGIAVFMTNSTSHMGLYNDANNQWALYSAFNGETQIHHAGVNKINTTSSGANIQGDLNAVDNIYVAANIYHEGDTDTYVGFGTNAISLVAGGISGHYITPSYTSTNVPFYNYAIYYEDYDALSGTSVTVNCDTAQAFSLTMTGDTTFTFNSVSSAWSTGFVLELTGNGGTVTWPTSVDWAGGTAPDAPASGETDIYVFWTRDGGTTWYGVHSIDAAS
jgi:hypothetical protein